MWNNYFFQIQKKYSMRLSLAKPLVIRLDGKDVTKNSKINIMDEYKGSFLDALKKTAKYFSEKYHCLSILGSDEISFIIFDPNIAINDLEPNDKTNYSNEIIAMFSQYFYNYFNRIFKLGNVFWHAKCFSINEDKVVSYLKYRSRIIENVLVTYFLKKKNDNIQDEKLNDKIKRAEKYKDYIALQRIQHGILYLDGKQIDLQDYIENNKTICLDADKNVEVELVDF